MKSLMIWVLSRPVKYIILIYLLFKKDLFNLRKKGILSSLLIIYFSMLLIVIFIKPSYLILLVIILMIMGGRK